MKTPTFSLFHATRGRPSKAVEAMKRVKEMARYPERVEYIFAVDNDDERKLRISTVPPDFPFSPQVVYGDFKGSVAAWNAAAKHSTGGILIQMQDDLEMPKWWDSDLIRRTSLYRDRPLVVAVSDGYRNDGLLCTAICNRLRYEQQGEFLHHGYRSVFSDDEFSVRSYADARDGKCKLIDAHDLIFRHRHHYHDPVAVGWDDTYARQNDPKSYESGRKLFEDRNKHLIDLGLKTWR